MLRNSIVAIALAAASSAMPSSSASSRSRCRRNARALLELAADAAKKLGWTGAAAQLGGQPAQARRADRGDDPGQGRRPHPVHGQAHRGRGAVREREEGEHSAGHRRVGTSPHSLFDIQVNDYVGGAQATMYLLSKMNYKGEILTARFEQNVASRIRGKELDVILSENPAVKVLGSHSMSRTASWRDDVRNGMQALILQNKGKFQGVWASWDGRRGSSTTSCARRATRRATW
jgi:hypothetical protein